MFTEVSQMFYYAKPNASTYPSYQTPGAGSFRMKNINFFMIFAPILLLVCVTAELIITESEWKSLEKQQNRDLFFQILQSYFTGKGVNLGLGRNERLQEADASKVNSYEDKFDNDLDT